MLLATPIARAQSPDEMEVRGDELSFAMIRRVVQRGAGEALRRCYADRIAARPRLHGRWIVRFVIAAGHVTDATVTAAGEPDAELERCTAEALRAVAFPLTSGGVITVTWPFDFTRRRATGPPRVRLDGRGPYVVRPLAR